MLAAIPWRLVGVAAVLLVIATMGLAIKTLKVKLNDARNEVAELVTANLSTQQTIKTQGDALAQWRALAVTPEEAALAVASLNSTMALAKEMRGALAKSKEIDRAKPDCAAWLAADFEGMCPTVARGLRDIAAHKDSRGRSTGPSGEAFTSRTHEGLRTALPVPANAPDGRGAD